MGSIENDHRNEEEACLNALMFSHSKMFPWVLHTAIELDLFKIIAKAGPGAYVSAFEIASQLPTTNPEAPSILNRMLRVLATHSFLSYSSRTLEDSTTEKLYTLTPACKFFLGSTEEGSLAPLLALGYQRSFKEAEVHLKDVVLEGGNVYEKAYGISMFEYSKKDPEFNNSFNQAMAGLSTIMVNEILAIYKGFEGFSSLVDVGGGIGRSLNMIISKFPSIKGINYDLPHVIQSAPPYPGIQHVGGDMFTSVPKGDAVMIKEIFHNWTDEDVILVLRNIYQVLPDNGKLIIIEAQLAEGAETTKESQYISVLDFLMFSLLSGKERTANEFEALTKAAGFSQFRVACVVHGIWAVMESYK